MNEKANPSTDVARRVLAELAEMAEHASLTRGLGGGEPAAARAYNSALDALSAANAVPAAMFERLDPDATTYGLLAVQARLLLAVTREEPSRHQGRRREGGLDSVVALAPFLDSDDLAQMLRERIDETTEVSDGLLTALAPFLDSDDLGDLVRRRMRPRPPQPPTPPTPPTQQPAPDLTPAFRAEPPESLETLADRLGRPDITLEERKRIATRLAELAFEQATHG